MADQGPRGRKRASEAERLARLDKRAKLGDRGKEKVGSASGAPPRRFGDAPSQQGKSTGPPGGSATRGPVPPASQPAKPTDRPEGRSGRPRDDRPSGGSSTQRGHRDEQRPRDIVPAAVGDSARRGASTHKSLVTKFSEGLTLDVAESSRRSNPVEAFHDSAGKLIEVSTILLDSVLGVLSTLSLTRVIPRPCASSSQGMRLLGAMPTAWRGRTTTSG